jgi:hypothetical protein
MGYAQNRYPQPLQTEALTTNGPETPATSRARGGIDGPTLRTALTLTTPGHTANMEALVRINKPSIYQCYEVFTY